MEFLGIGPQEIIVILVIAVIVVGPKRLPEFAVQLARLVRRLRGYATDVTQEMRAELDELTREYERIRAELDEVRQSTEKDVDSMTVEVDRALKEAPAIIESSAEPPPEERDHSEEPRPDTGS